MEVQRKTPVKDGGWGWMVVLGTALINMVNQALFSVFGLVFGEELKEMAHGHATGITLVMSVSVCVTNFSGLAVGPMMKKLSVRTVTGFGVICVGVGMIISSFATEIWHIVIGYGAFTGLGLGLVASSSFLAINDYFTTRKSTAVGLAMAGTSIGQMLMPLFVGFLLKNYEYSGTTLILGCLSFSGILGVLLFKPMFCFERSSQNDQVEEGVEHKSANLHYDQNFNGKLDESEKHSSHDETQKLISHGGSPSPTITKSDNPTPYMATTVEADKQKRKKLPPLSFLERVAKFLDLQLLSDLKFDHILIGLGLGYLSTVSFSTFFPMFLQDEVVFSMWQTTSCMTALSAADIVGRMTISEVCRKLRLGNRSSFMVGAVLLAFCRSFLVAMTDYKYVLLASILTGYFRAATVVNQNLVISEYIAKEHLPGAVGLNMVVKGIIVISLGEPLGYLKDAFDYSVCIHLLDVILLIIVLSWSIEILICKRLQRRTLK